MEKRSDSWARRSVQAKAQGGCDGLTAERVVAAWPAKAGAEVLHLGDRTGRRRAAGRARHPPPLTSA
jgi:hypothetical protein